MRIPIDAVGVPNCGRLDADKERKRKKKKETGKMIIHPILTNHSMKKRVMTP